jgi:hypothetical protein
MNEVSFKINTEITEHGQITQIVSLHHDDTMTIISRTVMDAQDAGVREALIKLGWTPPYFTQNLHHGHHRPTRTGSVGLANRTEGGAT